MKLTSLIFEIDITDVVNATADLDPVSAQQIIDAVVRDRLHQASQVSAHYTNAVSNANPVVDGDLKVWLQKDELEVCDMIPYPEGV